MLQNMHYHNWYVTKKSTGPYQYIIILRSERLLKHLTTMHFRQYINRKCFKMKIISHMTIASESKSEWSAEKNISMSYLQIKSWFKQITSKLWHFKRNFESYKQFWKNMINMASTCPWKLTFTDYSFRSNVCADIVSHCAYDVAILW